MTSATDHVKRLAYVFDIDGTLALIGNRKPYDWHLVGGDLPNIPVIMLAQATQLVYATPLLTGRKKRCEAETRAWLRKWVCDHGIGYCFCDERRTPMWMRRDDDNRSSEIVKYEMMMGSELYPDPLMGYFDVYAVVEDWGKMIRMWRRNGFTAIDVAGNEF